MFEIIMFWFWVSALCFFLLDGIWRLIVALMGKWVNSLAEKGGLDSVMYGRRLEDTLLWPSNKVYRLFIPKSKVEDPLLVGFPALLASIGIYFIIGLTAGVNNFSFDVSGVIDSISLLSKGLAGFTSWMVIPLIIVLIVNKFAGWALKTWDKLQKAVHKIENPK